MRKGIFIPEITVEMFRNATLEAVEELLVSGTMEDIEIPERPHGDWEYLKEHITEMRDADGKLNQKETCQFILNLMAVIEREGEQK